MYAFESIYECTSCPLLTSIAAEITGPRPHAYTASKHALLGLVKSACGGLEKYRIRVNGVAPYAVATGLNSYDEETATVILKGVVASDDSAYVSGQSLAVDGGFSLVKPMAM